MNRIALCCVVLLCFVCLLATVAAAETPPPETTPPAETASTPTAPDPSPAPAGEAPATGEAGSPPAAADLPAAPAAVVVCPPETEIEVEVTATHEWPAKVQVVTPCETEKMVNAPFLGDVLERLPGVDTLHGCLNGAQLITIRGNNSEWSEVLFEGIPISPIGRPYILSYVPMTAIDCTRILTGPIPPKYCVTTMAGLVLLDMKTGDRYPGVQLTETVGGYGESILSANVGGGNADRNYFLSFTHNRTEGWLPHSDMNFNFISGKFVLRPDACSKLTLVAADLYGDKNGPRPLGPNPTDKWSSEWTDVQQPKAALTYERQLSDRQDISLRLIPTWFSGTQTWTQWFRDHTEERFMPWEYDLFQAQFQHNIKLSSERIWTWGLCWEKDAYRFTNPLRLSFWDNIPDDSWHNTAKRQRSIYAQYTQPTGGTGTLTLGGRYDSESPGQSLVSPFASWYKHLNACTGLRLAVGRNRRFPNLSELYGQGVWIGNPNLQPETGWSYQVDLTRNLRNATVGVSVFDMELQDLIVADAQNAYNNLGEARLNGLEASWQSNWRKGIVWANYTFLNGENTMTGDPLIACFRTAFPRNSVKAGISMGDAERGEQSLEVLAYGPRRTDVDHPTYVGAPWFVTVPPRIPGFTWVNYKYTWPLRNKGTLTFAVSNIFNVEGQDLVFFPRPGRWVSGSICWGF